MARRNHRSVKKRRQSRSATATAAAKKRANCRQLPVQPPNNKTKRPSMDNTIIETTPSNKTRRRNNNHHNMVIVPTYTTPSYSYPLPLAVYQPAYSASLFAMLLVASLLPKNTFSLRWLALSGSGGGGGRSSSNNNINGNGNHHHLPFGIQTIGSRPSASSGNGCLLFGTRQRCGSGTTTKEGMSASSTSLCGALAMMDPEIMGKRDLGDTAVESSSSSLTTTSNRKAMLALLWKDVSTTLEKTIHASIIKSSSHHPSANASSGINNGSNDDEEEEDWSLDDILQHIPRGGGGRRGGRGDYDNNDNNNHRSYPGLVNLGNTCYLNAQLQCAYHVPYLRQLILEARDEMVEVEVEVEIEVEVEDDDEEAEEEAEEEGASEMMETAQVKEEGADNEEAMMETETTTEAKHPNLAQQVDTTPMEEGEYDVTEQTPQLPQQQQEGEEIINSDFNGETTSSIPTTPTPKKKTTKTILQKQTQEKLQPISTALRALQHTFLSLDKATSSSSSKRSTSTTGSTNVLCRALGINPYLQQDGQEFWKLFVPELDYDTVSKLYSGYFEDYVREIVVVGDNDDDDDGVEEKELVEEDYDYWDEEKKVDDYNYDDVHTDSGDAREARERVRTEPFLDLSIPVAEGTGGSVESTLREMFTQPEILRVSEGNGWRPSKGADKVDAYKGSSLKDDGLPSLLQLHLKRFKYDWETGETSKINDCCSFPLELDLSEISEANEDEAVEGENIYDLQSIVIHKGEYGSGHYYSYVRPDIQQNKWYRFDDEFVTPVEFSDVIADAYGGSRKARRKRARSDSFENINDSVSIKRRRGPLQLVFSLFGMFLRVPKMIVSSPSGGGGGGFGYGGRASSAYMIQYVRRSDIPTLYGEGN